jgi:hypothetical protein
MLVALLIVWGLGVALLWVAILPAIWTVPTTQRSIPVLPVALAALVWPLLLLLALSLDLYEKVRKE